MPRAPDHPVPLEEWKELREIVGECQKEMKDLLDLAEEDPLVVLLRELKGSIKSYKQQGPSHTHPFVTPVGPPKKKEETPPEQEGVPP